jgi:hypothetical protein
VDQLFELFFFDDEDPNPKLYSAILLGTFIGFYVVFGVVFYRYQFFLKEHEEMGKIKFKRASEDHKIQVEMHPSMHDMKQSDAGAGNQHSV